MTVPGVDHSSAPGVVRSRGAGRPGWRSLAAAAAVSWVLSGCAWLQHEDDGASSVHWEFERLDEVDGHPMEVLGSVLLERDNERSALAFDGVDDGLIVHHLPLAGADEFTLEIVFRPAAGGLAEQRFLHLQEDGSESRILIETRLFEGNTWALDSYIRTPAGSHALYDANIRHPLDEWYNATLVYDGVEMRHYVNGEQELAGPLNFQPLGPGKVSVGVRMNRVFWFKGLVRSVRFTPAVLDPAAFLTHEK